MAFDVPEVFIYRFATQKAQKTQTNTQTHNIRSNRFNGDSIQLTDLWMAYCMHKNLQVKFQHQNNAITGIFKGLNNNGQAIIDYNNETIAYNGAINLIV